MRLTLPLPFLLMAALAGGCSGSIANTPAISTQTQSTRPVAALDESKHVETAHLKIRLIAPLDATLTRTGVVLTLDNPECKHEHVPKRLDKGGFPLDATPFTPPHTAWLTLGLPVTQDPCTKRPNTSAVRPMTVVTPAPVPSSTPVFSANGLYVVALDAATNSQITVLDVAGPAPAAADGTLNFTLSKLSLSADDSYAFYLATLSSHGHDDSRGDGDDGEIDDD